MNIGHKLIKVAAMIFAVDLFIVIASGITTVFVMGTEVFDNAGSNNKINFTKEFEDIKSIKVESGDISVTILPTDKEQIMVKAEHVSKNVKARQIGDELVIDNCFYIGDWFNWFNDRNKMSSITIFLPKDITLLEADIESGSGELDVRDMSVDNFMLDGGSGDITLSGISATEYEIDLGSGDCVVKESKLEDGELDSGSGKVYFKDCTIADTEFSTGSGSIEFDGKLLGENTFDGGSGALNVKLHNPITDYNIDIDLGSGNGYINGKRIDDEYCEDHADCQNEIIIDGGSGRVDLDFLE